jgi:hypothetical protein
MNSSFALEPHFTPLELAGIWRVSPQFIRKIFADEPGVLLIGEPSRRVGKKLKRSYLTMRIPHAVAERVHQRRSSKRQ